MPTDIEREADVSAAADPNGPTLGSAAPTPVAAEEGVDTRQNLRSPHPWEPRYADGCVTSRAHKAHGEAEGPCIAYHTCRRCHRNIPLAARRAEGLDVDRLTAIIESRMSNDLAWLGDDGKTINRFGPEQVAHALLHLYQTGDVVSGLPPLNHICAVTLSDGTMIHLKDAADLIEEHVTGAVSAEADPEPPLHGHNIGGDWLECTDEHLPARARGGPSVIDVLRDLRALHRKANEEYEVGIGLRELREFIEKWEALAPEPSTQND